MTAPAVRPLRRYDRSGGTTTVTVQICDGLESPGQEFTLEERGAMKRVWLTTGFLLCWLPVSVPASWKDPSCQLARLDSRPVTGGSVSHAPRREDPQEQRKYPTSIEVQVGSERIAVAGARGFVEPTQAFPNLREFAERYVRPASRLLAVFLLEKSLPAGDKGDVGDLSRYILVETDRSYEQKNLSTSSFSRTKMELRMLVDDSMRKSFDDVRASLKKTDPALDLAAVEKSGWVDEGDRYISFGMLVRSTDPSGSRVVVSVGATVLVKGKALSFLVYAPFTSYEDVVWAEGVSKELIANVLRDNQ
jgi:hypothetical protein